VSAPLAANGDAMEQTVKMLAKRQATASRLRRETDVCNWAPPGVSRAEERTPPEDQVS
jgi:hypothetical protein